MVFFSCTFQIYRRQVRVVNSLDVSSNFSRVIKIKQAGIICKVRVIVWLLFAGNSFNKCGVILKTGGISCYNKRERNFTDRTDFSRNKGEVYVKKI